MVAVIRSATPRRRAGGLLATSPQVLPAPPGRRALSSATRCCHLTEVAPAGRGRTGNGESGSACPAPGAARHEPSQRHLRQAMMEQRGLAARASSSVCTGDAAAIGMPQQPEPARVCGPPARRT
ncbi:hypothetical protein ACRAWF_18850 [Streptomyces sp. L7]